MTGLQVAGKVSATGHVFLGGYGSSERLYRHYRGFPSVMAKLCMEPVQFVHETPGMDVLRLDVVGSTGARNNYKYYYRGVLVCCM